MNSCPTLVLCRISRPELVRQPPGEHDDAQSSGKFRRRAGSPGEFEQARARNGCWMTLTASGTTGIFQSYRSASAERQHAVIDRHLLADVGSNSSSTANGQMPAERGMPGRSGNGRFPQPSSACACMAPRRARRWASIEEERLTCRYKRSRTDRVSFPQPGSGGIYPSNTAPTSVLCCPRSSVRALRVRAADAADDLRHVSVSPCLEFPSVMPGGRRFPAATRDRARS